MIFVAGLSSTRSFLPSYCQPKKKKKKRTGDTRNGAIPGGQKGIGGEENNISWSLCSDNDCQRLLDLESFRRLLFALTFLSPVLINV